MPQLPALRPSRWKPLRCGAMLLAGLLPLVSAWAACSRPIDVPVADGGLIVSVDKQQVGGVYPELLRELGARIGCTFVFHPVPRARQEMLFMARRSDLFMPAQRTDRRDPFGQHVALLQVRPVLMALRPLPASLHQRSDLVEHAELRLAVLRGVDYGARYRELLEQLRERKRLVTEADAAGLVRALRTGVADAVLINPERLRAELDTPEAGSTEAWQVRPLDDLSWQNTGLYLSLERLPEADRQLLAQALGDLQFHQRLWQSLLRAHPASNTLLQAGYRPLPRPEYPPTR